MHYSYPEAIRAGPSNPEIFDGITVNVLWFSLQYSKHKLNTIKYNTIISGQSVTEIVAGIKIVTSSRS